MLIEIVEREVRVTTIDLEGGRSFWGTDPFHLQRRMTMAAPDERSKDRENADDRETVTEEEIEEAERKRSPLDGPGRSGGTAGTGGVNKTQDP